MDQPTPQHTVARIDWDRTFWFASIFRAFRLATQPAKLALAVVLVVAMFVVGVVLDQLIGGERVLPGEFTQYTQAAGEPAFDDWRAEQRDQLRQQLAWQLRTYVDGGYDQALRLVEQRDPWQEAETLVHEHFRQQRADLPDAADDDPDAAEARQARLEQLHQQERQVLDRIDRLRPTGVFVAVLEIKVEAFSNLIDAAVNLRFGFDQLNPRNPLRPATMIGAIRTVLYELPLWLWHVHTVFLVIWLVVFVIIWSLLGGAISRLATVEAARGDRLGMSDGVRFAFRRWFSYAATPLIPLAFVALLGLVIAVGGLLFHAPLLDIVGALLFVVALPLAFVMAMLLILWVGGVHLMYPALAAEGTDAFDAVSRSYSYVLARPWRLAWYTLVTLAYGVVTYLFVGLVVFLTLRLAQAAGSAFTAPLQTVLPPPELGDLGYFDEVAWTELGWSQRIAAVVVSVWVYLLIAVVAAYAVSYYFSAFSMIYLLLRRCCDGTEVGEVFRDNEPEPASAEKVEPAPATASATGAGGSDASADEQ
jgi:hypothetical protein